ncbi:MAG: matrixin family metalloprotease [Nanoarchaeota archaeon]
MGWKIVISFVFAFFAVLLLVLYWFFPISTTEFQAKFNESPDFIVNKSALQFYNNMRFPDSSISYKIVKCPLKKMNDMQDAFRDVSALTLLSFYPVLYDEEITVTCDSTERIEDGLFIAGEGGPTNITQSGSFNVISHGKILLIKESSCSNPNIGIHELFHVLGFDHIPDSKSIMYPISNCDQEIDNEIIDAINELYSIPNRPDLVFENVSAVMHGKYLGLNFSVRNIGLSSSSQAKVIISSGNSVIKELDVDVLPVGHGRIITLTNVWISKLSVDSIKLQINYGLSELKKENNEAILEIKNKN